jgi:hypothetical protein
MKVTIKTALLFAGAFILIKLLFMQLGLFSTTITVPGSINNLFLLLSITIGLFLHKKKEGFHGSSALGDIKNGLTAALPYVMIVSMFLGLYYGKIDRSFLSSKMEERNEVAKKQLSDPIMFKRLLSEHPEWESKTKEEILHDFSNSSNAALSANSIMITSLLALTLLGAFYSIMITFIFRRVLVKGIRE